MSAPPRHSLEEIEVELRRRFPDLLGALGIRHEMRGDRFWMLSPLRKDPNWTSFDFNRVSGLWKDHFLGPPYSGKGALSFVCMFATDGRWKSDFDKAGGHVVRPGAVQWALDWLGWTDRAPDPVRARAAKDELARIEANMIRKAEEGRRKAKAIWLAGTPLDGTDPASRYLLLRGIDPKALPGGAWPRALRFHREVWAQDDDAVMRGPHPAMVAAISDERIADGFAAVHRTYLLADGTAGKLTWAACKTGKQVKGRFAGGSIRLTNGASGKPLREAAKTEWAQISEGIEDGLTGAMAQPDIRALAAVSIGNIGGLHLPVPLQGVYILKQNDDEPAAIGQFDAAMDTLCGRGIEPVIVPTPPQFKDPNDALRGKQKVDA